MADSWYMLLDQEFNWQLPLVLFSLMITITKMIVNENKTNSLRKIITKTKLTKKNYN